MAELFWELNTTAKGKNLWQKRSRSLIVRMAGYSDYFCDLSKTLLLIGEW